MLHAWYGLLSFLHVEVDDLDYVATCKFKKKFRDCLQSFSFSHHLAPGLLQRSPGCNHYSISSSHPDKENSPSNSAFSPPLISTDPQMAPNSAQIPLPSCRGPRRAKVLGYSGKNRDLESGRSESSSTAYRLHNAGASYLSTLSLHSTSRNMGNIMPTSSLWEN